MSKISDIYDKIVERIPLALSSPSDLTRLPHSSFLENNAALFLRRGFGVHFGAGVNTEEVIGCQISIERTFLVSLTKEDVSIDIDPLTTATNQKLLMEDLKLIIDDLYQNTEFNILYNNDGGIIPVFEEKKKFFFIEAAFNVTYFETIP